jgi:DNA-binding transcriptional LysR family regulator
LKLRIGFGAGPEQPDISIRALRAFVEVMHSGSATAAAKQLQMTQPAISRLIAQVEERYGFELFFREKGRLVATEDGKRFLSEVELALSNMERLHNIARDISGLTAGSIRVVAPPSFSEAILPDIVAAFLKRHPGVEFSIDSRSAETARSMIAMRYADCGFVKMPVDEKDLATDVMMTNNSVCVMHRDHPLAGLDSVSPAEILDAPLILLGAGRRWRSQVDQAFAEYGRRPSVSIETHTHGSACALAFKRIGMAILNERLAKPYLRGPLVARPFQPHIVHRYAFATSNLSPPSRLTLAFKEVAADYFSNAP